MAKNPDDGNLPMPGSMPGSGGEPDWLCYVCGNVNRALRTRCNMSVCHAPKGFPGPFSAPLGGSDDDVALGSIPVGRWVCPECGEVNRARRLGKCFRPGCAGQRPLNVAEPNHLRASSSTAASSGGGGGGRIGQDQAARSSTWGSRDSQSTTAGAHPSSSSSSQHHPSAGGAASHSMRHHHHHQQHQQHLHQTLHSHSTDSLPLSSMIIQHHQRHLGMQSQLHHHQHHHHHHHQQQQPTTHLAYFAPTPLHLVQGHQQVHLLQTSSAAGGAPTLMRLPFSAFPQGQTIFGTPQTQFLYITGQGQDGDGTAFQTQSPQ